MNDFFSPDFYISREKEIEAISEGLKEKGAVTIIGHAGTGKTVLAKMYAQQNVGSTLIAPKGLFGHPPQTYAPFPTSEQSLK